MIDLENSMILEFELNKQTLKRIDNYEPVEKSQVYLQIHFNFDKDWDNTEKHVFFQFREEKVYEEILVGDTCYVPLEVIKKYGFYVWLIGYDLETHNVKIPTNQVRVAVKEGSPTDSGEATYVTDIVSDTITFEKSGNTYRAEIPNVYVTAISFNELTGQLKFLGRTENEEEKVLGEVDLPVERTLKSIVYNQETESLVFNFDNAPTIEVPIGDMFELDDYYNKEQIAILLSQMRESIIKELTDKGIFYDDSELRNEIKKLNENKVDKVTGYGLSKNDLTDELLSKLNSLSNYDVTEVQNKIKEIETILTSDDTDLDTLQELVTALKNNTASINDIFTAIASKQDKLTFDTTPTASSTNPVTSGGVKTALDLKENKSNLKALAYKDSLTKSDVGLGNVVNTGDSATPVSGGTTKFTTGGAYTELAKKVDKVTGYGLSKNDFTNALLTKLNGIEEGANKYVLPNNVVKDSNYVHTDNNYTTEEKNKLAGLQNYDDTSIRADITNLGQNTYNKTETQELIDQAIQSAISSSLRGDY